jgi:hypothetical protein
VSNLCRNQLESEQCLWAENVRTGRKQFLLTKKAENIYILMKSNEHRFLLMKFVSGVRFLKLYISIPEQIQFPSLWLIIQIWIGCNIIQHEANHGGLVLHELIVIHIYIVYLIIQ